MEYEPGAGSWRTRVIPLLSRAVGLLIERSNYPCEGVNNTDGPQPLVRGLTLEAMDALDAGDQFVRAFPAAAAGMVHAGKSGLVVQSTARQ